ncbi:hypothetical protein CBOM_05701 [Ceraceosorus bombacis]|uniref:Uncharacterized protein n=1 Tax=Ceraceosorus bombacis TaxID=401625 RepID=A0A0P1BRL2_9BASI|nr:hypothetical protein CBOM_05701 [Ceraceosorus bombacis]
MVQSYMQTVDSWMLAFQFWDFAVCLPNEWSLLYLPEARRWIRSHRPPSVGTIFLE